jgi:hypothetical protein
MLTAQQVMELIAKAESAAGDRQLQWRILKTILLEQAKTVDVLTRGSYKLSMEVAQMRGGRPAAPGNGAAAPEPATPPPQQAYGPAPSGAQRFGADGQPLTPEQQAQEEQMDAAIEASKR